MRPTAGSRSGTAIRGARWFLLGIAGVLGAAGCGRSASSNSGGNKGIAEGTFTLKVQNGQDGAALAIKHGYVTSSPAGIDCGVAPHAACSAQFAIDGTVTLTGHPDSTTSPPYAVLLWAGDCSGVDTTCSLRGRADQYVVVVFGTEAERTAHSNFTDAVVHGPAWDAFAAGAAGALDCVKCHGANMQGQGIAIGCNGCHAWPMSASGQIGTTGGTVALSGGPTLTVGSGALAAATTITITNTTTFPALPADTELLGPVYDFVPNGQTFSIPVTVSFPIPAGTTDATVLWTNAAGTAFDDIGGAVVGATVQAQVSHFSKGGPAAKKTFTVGGTVAGLFGAGFAVAMNNGSPLPVIADGTFTFPNSLQKGATYSITVVQQPINPAQVCEVAGGTGVVARTITDVRITCGFVPLLTWDSGNWDSFAWN